MNLKSIIHFCDNENYDSNTTDKVFMVPTLIRNIPKSFKKFRVLDKDLSIDELIVK